MTDPRNLQARAAALLENSKRKLEEELSELEEIRDEINQILDHS